MQAIDDDGVVEGGSRLAAVSVLHDQRRGIDTAGHIRVGGKGIGGFFQRAVPEIPGESAGLLDQGAEDHRLAGATGKRIRLQGGIGPLYRNKIYKGIRGAVIAKTMEHDPVNARLGIGMAGVVLVVRDTAVPKIPGDAVCIDGSIDKMQHDGRAGIIIYISRGGGEGSMDRFYKDHLFAGIRTL